MLTRCEAYAAAPLPVLPRTDEDQMLQFMRMMSDMPRQQGDQATGQVKVENMLRHLGHLPRVCLSWMLGQVHVRFTFFPSIKELLDLSKEWTRGDDAIQARSLAKRLARDERQARLNDTRRSLRTAQQAQEWVDALEDRTKDILEAEGLLWRCDCGSFVQRNQWRDVVVDTGERLTQIADRFGGFPATDKGAA